MTKWLQRNRKQSGTVMGRLRSDVRGNTLAIMAIALIPMSALAGSAIDTARLYVVKVRLQQACDAGVLAGRKFMTSSDSTTLDATATARANDFFKNNFTSGWMRTNTVVFTPTKTADQQVAGTATAVVPMTIMKMFKAGDVPVSVSCQARFDVADTDVMFVLDTTGSMACLPSDSETTCSNYAGTSSNWKSYTRSDGSNGYYVDEKSGSRIAALRTAVMSFYDTFAANADSTTHVRYGFVPYTSTVNAGRDVYAVSSSYLVPSWTYQSRYVTGDYTIKTNSSSTVNAANSTACAANYKRTPATALTYTSSGTATLLDPVWSSNYNGSTCTLYNRTIGPVWTYKQLTLDTSKYIQGAAITDPTRVDSATTTWQGCVEERKTTAGTTTFSQSSLPADLDPDLIPLISNADTQWRPLWPDVTYIRNSTTGYYSNSTGTDTTNGDDLTAAPPMDAPSPMQRGFQTCGKRVARLGVMTRSQVNDYVYATDFKAIGGTYHDVGMIWGTRMLAPKGIFAADTATWPGRKEPKRVLVFMTDGDMAPSQYIYGMYGMEYFDKRVTNGDFTNIKDYHNARFLAECSAAKARNIDVWVVAVGQSLTTQLTSCATTSSQALYAGTGADLSTAFQTIAKQIAMLRISQ